jgi:hypothetical protein
LRPKRFHHEEFRAAKLLGGNLCVLELFEIEIYFKALTFFNTQLGDRVKTTLSTAF